MSTSSGKSFPRRLGIEQNADYEERRLIVLREAARVFAERGIQQTTIDEIAERLSVTKPTVYHYVSNKDQIVYEVLRIASQAFEAYFDDLKRQPLTGREKLEALFRHYSRSVADDFGRVLVTVDVKALKPVSLEEFRRVRRATIEAVRGLVEDGIRDGSIRRQDPRLVTYALLGAFNFIGQWLRPGGPLGADAVADGFLDIFTKGIAGPGQSG